MRKELNHAINVKSALTYRSNAEMRAARKSFPDVFEIINLVTPCMIKHDTQGQPVKYKFRITAADAASRTNSKFQGDTYSGALEESSTRFLTSITRGRGGKLRYLDVEAVYFNGRKTPPTEQGGRSLWTPVPDG